jgi:heterodisulfide reductase subunit A
MPVKIGVFICHCGTNIGGIVNVPEVVEYARTLPNVVFSEENLYTCSEDGLSSIRNKIKEYDLNRVVVASCTPRTHEPLFRQNCVLAGLNKYLFEFVNLREHCSWVHMERHDDATIKAKDLVRMGAAKVALLTQKKDRLGGLLKDINRIFPSNEPTSQFLDPLISSVSKHENINVHLESELIEMKGFIGNFTVKLKNDSETEELKIGTIIVSTGAEELKPTGSFGYDRFDNVMTQLEFERKYKPGYDGLNRVVMINCVGARIEERPYCGRFCCITGMKNAILLKEANPGAEISILQRDIMACGKVFEDYYRKALDMGIRFIRYNAGQPPEIAGSGNVAGKVKVYHELMGRDIELDADIVLLTTPLIPGEDNQQLSRMMKIPVGNDGFFLEAHQKLRPVEFPSDGIFIAGCARYPTDILECISQGYAAAAKAAIPMAQGRVITDAFISEVNPLRCSACGRCVDICPFGAIDWTEWKGPKGKSRSVASINPTECKGCGLCVSSCLSGAIELKGFTDEEILAMVNTVIDSHQIALNPTAQVNKFKLEDLF